jgi:hypothetical protein
MTFSLYLPKGEHVSSFVSDANWLPFFLTFVLLALTLYFIAARRIALAWMPALMWLVVTARECYRLAVWVPAALERGYSWPYLSLWPLTAVIGGGCVLVASLRTLGRPEPQTDVSAFE